ncbi:Ubiquitin carboxyl-terminal hydrolase 1 [Pleurostoma richardsiae]|uniref:ubiquitinyl hydrolase 1 n=1 Tax=Pleurostoma richardsiae TaxID=41990 RepID=A0AA38S0D3_9PEZI|nr:Ubiquitin carboxyl-terminal hydrolase 1 [Pleurostoma richardsiae]
MSAPASPGSRFHDSFYAPDTYQFAHDHDHARVWDRIREPSALVPALVLLCSIIYHYSHSYAASRGRPLPSLLHVIWDTIVFATPASVLYAIDSWIDPPLFPLPMLHSQPTTHAAKSDVLRKILGMDKPGGIVATVSQAGRRTLSGSFPSLGLKGGLSGPAGLGNWDNSCFQNSILQGLAALKPLPSYLAGLALQGESARVPTETVQALRDLIDELNDPTNNGKTLWTPKVLKNMNTWQQQDAQEYYSKLLEEIDKETARAAKTTQKPAGLETDPTRDDSTSSQHSDDSGYQSLSTISKGSVDLKTTRNPLEGLLAQRVACIACGHSGGLSMIPFNCLTLSLGLDKTEFDLYERLDSYIHVEAIPGVECAKCTLLKVRRLLNIILERSRSANIPDENLQEPLARLQAADTALEEDDFDDETLKTCKIGPAQMVSSTKTKQAVVARPPRSLAIHMNRSVFNERTGYMFKNPADVRFPMTLDLGPWCLGSADPLTSQVTANSGDALDEKVIATASDYEQWLLDPKSSMAAGDQHPSKVTGPIYELRAVITHRGRHENGHYICYRKHSRTSRTEQDEKFENKADQPPQLAMEVDADDVSSLHEQESGKDQPHKTLESVNEAESRWWMLSDQNVSQVSEEHVLGQGGVFMLFYDCVDPNSILTSDVDSPDIASEIICTPQNGSTPSTEASEAMEALVPLDSRSGGALARHSSRTSQHKAVAPTRSVPLPSNIGGNEVLARAQSIPLPTEDDGVDLL